MDTGVIAPVALLAALIIAIGSAVAIVRRGRSAFGRAIGITAAAIGVNALLAALTNDLTYRQFYFVLVVVTGIISTLIISVGGAIEAGRRGRG